MADTSLLTMLQGLGEFEEMVQEIATMIAEKIGEEYGEKIESTLKNIEEYMDEEAKSEKSDDQTVFILITVCLVQSIIILIAFFLIMYTVCCKKSKPKRLPEPQKNRVGTLLPPPKSVENGEKVLQYRPNLNVAPRQPVIPEKSEPLEIKSKSAIDDYIKSLHYPKVPDDLPPPPRYSPPPNVDL